MPHAGEILDRCRTTDYFVPIGKCHRMHNDVVFQAVESGILGYIPRKCRYCLEGMDLRTLSRIGDAGIADKRPDIHHNLSVKVTIPYAPPVIYEHSLGCPFLSCRLAKCKTSKRNGQSLLAPHWIGIHQNESGCCGQRRPVLTRNSHGLHPIAWGEFAPPQEWKPQGFTMIRKCPAIQFA